MNELNIIYKVAKYIHKPNANLDFEDIVSLCSEAYVFALEDHKIEISSFFTWFLKKAKWTVMDYCRKNIKKEVVECEYMDNFIFQVDHSHKTLEDIYFDNIIKCLDKRDSKILEMYREGYNFRQIGLKIKLTESQTSRRFNSAVKKIKKEVPC